MPELPEVETIRQQLEKTVLGKRINGKMINSIQRRGKFLIINLESGTSLVFHLKMTGQLLINAKPTIYTRRIFKIDDKTLIFNDIRKFGWCKEVKDGKKIESALGMEPLEMSFDDFKSLLNLHPIMRIKYFLTNQKIIAGIGNIYANEILWASKIHPLRTIQKLSDREIKIIFKNIKKILKMAIKYRGSSISNYLDLFSNKGEFSRYHKVYQKAGQHCARCGTVIKKITIGSRSSYFCPLCQK